MTPIDPPVLTRRALLGSSAVGGLLAASGALTAPSATAATSAASAFRAPGLRHSAAVVRAAAREVAPDAWALQPFPLSAVSLGQSVFTRAQKQALILNRAYSVDALLAVFRRNAGLGTRGATPPGGWEEFGPAPDDQRWGPSEYRAGQNARGAGGLLRGHFAGHFLSGLSMAYASTGEGALAQKVGAFVAGLEECRAALAAQKVGTASRYSHPGFLSAYGEWQFSALENYAPYGEIWAPYYTLHKIVAGLLDAHAYTGNTLALSLAEGIGHWVYSRLSKCAPAQLQKMWSLYIAGECGGMNDVLVELYWRSADPAREEFLQAAKLFTYDALVDACADDRDTLDGRHANQYIPTFSGYLKLYDQTGEERYRTAVTNLFGMVVPGRAYAHGGTGEGELWGPADAVAGDIGKRNAESCAAYNMLKIARSLFLHDQDPRYMDYYERTVLNHILGGRRDAESTVSPENCYMFPVNPGTRKEYGDGNIGTCCGGTALESHVKYQDTIYFRSKAGDALYVNLYIASTLDWSDKGLTLVQTSSYPEADTSTLEFTRAPSGPFTLHVRIPAWGRGSSVSVNGERQDVDVAPGTYVALTRSWVAGDKVTVTIPLSLRAEPTPDRRDIQALVYGPVVLTAIDSSTRYASLALSTRAGLDGSIRRGVTQRSGNVFVIDGRTFEPAYSGKDVAYHMYFQRSEPTVAFAGVDSKVRNPTRGQGGPSLLEEVWAKAPFADRAAFLEAVRSVSQSFTEANLLTARDRQKVLLAAGRAPIDA
ncbi:beta-L-arabinofuranosidase domain-containing protein [Microbacterium sp. lyk4-40-TSB-66]|uniref:glycoside hydrolase family 127 protein n=1 Tax=Microbacterium sp. lyk4-40-TSB-66 TaxID=3040294 RepID=UPI00254A0CB5|nr:beta-L-arabinofuranosidase domain-containing protein [Microbacterium sp. lyk4-40-TSB-66]